MKTKTKGAVATKKPRARPTAKTPPRKRKSKLTPLTKPQLDDADFPNLHNGFNQSSNGTVTGPTIDSTHTVTIDGQGNKRWGGKVTTKVSGNTWNAAVKRVRTLRRGMTPLLGLEDISVTVTNTSNETSDPVMTTSDIIP
jgi:hypothetical protein